MENTFRQILGVQADAIDEVRSASPHEAQADDEEAARRRDAAVVDDLTCRIEDRRNVEPLVVSPISDRPYHRSDVLRRQIDAGGCRCEADGAGRVPVGWRISRVRSGIDASQQSLERLLSGRSRFRQVVLQTRTGPSAPTVRPTIRTPAACSTARFSVRLSGLPTS